VGVAESNSSLPPGLWFNCLRANCLCSGVQMSGISVSLLFGYHFLNLYFQIYHENYF